MSGFEYLIAFLMNVKGLFVALAIGTGIGGVIATIVAIVSTADREPQAAFVTKLAKALMGFFLFFGLVACVPDVDDLWKVRVGLIKLELSSPENIKALVNPDTIEKGKELIGKIGSDVYCKYVPSSELCKTPEKK